MRPIYYVAYQNNGVLCCQVLTTKDPFEWLAHRRSLFENIVLIYQCEITKEQAEMLETVL